MIVLEIIVGVIWAMLGIAMTIYIVMQGVVFVKNYRESKALEQKVEKALTDLEMMVCCDDSFNGEGKSK